MLLKRSKALKALLRVYILSLILASCSNNNDEVLPANSSDTIETLFINGAFNIGFVEGVPFYINPISLAIKHLNDAGGILGKKVNIIHIIDSPLFDNQQIAQEMIDKGIIIIGSAGSTRAISISKISIPNQVILMSGSSTSPTVTTLEDNDFIYRTVPNDIVTGKILAQLALDKDANTCAITFTQDDDFGTKLAEQFAIFFEGNGGVITDIVEVPENLSAGFSDLNDQLYQHNPDCVFNALIKEENAAAMLNEAAVNNFQGVYIFSEIALKIGFVNNIANPELIDGAQTATAGFGLTGASEWEFYNNAFEAQFGLIPGALTVTQYDSIIVSALAAEHAGYINGTAEPTGLMIRDSMREVMNPPGVKIGPSKLAEALSLIQSGSAINYTGAYGDTDFNSFGDVEGKLVYSVFTWNKEAANFLQDEQITLSGEQ